MDIKHHHDGPKRVGHELRDVSVRPIVIFGVSLALLIAISMVLMRGLFSFFERVEEGRDIKPSGIMTERPKQPPQPRLETQPIFTRKQIQANETAILESYGWLNEKTGSVRIPIRQAMQLIAERGLPSRTEKAGTVPKNDGTVIGQSGGLSENPAGSVSTMREHHHTGIEGEKQ